MLLFFLNFIQHTKGKILLHINKAVSILMLIICYSWNLFLEWKCLQSILRDFFNEFFLHFFLCFIHSIKTLPALAFENLNSLETLSIQNNKLTRIPEEVMEPIMDTLRVVDIMGKLLFYSWEFSFMFRIKHEISFNFFYFFLC